MEKLVVLQGVRPLLHSVRSAWRTMVQTLRSPRIHMGVVAGSSSLYLVRQHGDLQTIPSFLARELPSGRVVAVGEEACRLDGRTPPHIVVLRPFHGGAAMHGEAAVQLLKRFVKHTWLGRPRIVLAVSPSCTPVDRRSLTTALTAAGAGRLQLINRTMAAAVGAELPMQVPRGGMLVRVGAGTTEIGITALGGLVLTQTVPRGGDAMDVAIRDYLRRQHHLVVGERTAENVKRTVGCALPLHPPRQMEVGGRDLISGSPAKVQVSSTEICDALQNVLGSLAEQMTLAAGGATAEVLSDVMQSGVVLAGGGARLPRLDEFLTRQTGLPVRVAAQPEAVVSHGLQRIMRDRNLLRLGLLADALPEAAQHSHRATPQRRSLGSLLLAICLLWALQGSSVEGPLQQALSPLGAAVERTVARTTAVNAVAVTDLPQMADELRRKNGQLQRLSDDNQRLQALLGRQPLSPQTPLVAEVILRDPGNFLAMATLDAGAAEGVRPRAAIVTADGLVGQVVSVHPHQCQIRLITANNAVVACSVRGRNAGGILYGNGADTCELRYLDADATLRPGDQVVTSGQDGVYPRGLVVGSVQQLYPNRDAVYKSARVQPSAHFGALGPVLVLQGKSG